MSDDQKKAIPQKKIPTGSAKEQLMQISRGLEMIGEGISYIAIEGGEGMPDVTANGLGELMCWASREIERVAQSLPGKKAGAR